MYGMIIDVACLQLLIDACVRACFVSLTLCILQIDHSDASAATAGRIYDNFAE